MRVIKLLTYLIIIFIDALCFNIFLKLNLGTSPYGFFIYNFSKSIGLTRGTVAFLYAVLLIFIASRLRKTRFKFELLVNSFIFSFFIDIQNIFMGDLALNINLSFKIIILIGSILVLDLGRSLFEILPFPSDTVIEYLYGLREGFGINLKNGARFDNGTRVLGGVIFSYINGNFMQGIGIGTILILVFTGVFLEKFEKPLQRKYKLLVGD